MKINKKIVFFGAILMINFPSFARWDGTSTPWTQGNGSQQQPYLIETASQLAFLSDMVLGGVSYENKYFKLTNNISLSNVSWVPIGDVTNSFHGYFDGDGHIIDSVQILDSCYALSTPEKCYGLFGHTVNATIRNLQCNITVRQIRMTLSHLAQYCNYRIGGIVGIAEESVIDNCSISGLLYTNLVHFYSTNGTWGAVGGIVARAQGCVITNCTNHCEIHTQYYGGGIVGYAGQTIIKCCENKGAIYGDNRDNGSRSSVVIGGILGGTVYHDTVLVQICNNSGTIIANGTSGETVMIQAGGICANNAQSGYVEYCYNTGNINANKEGPLSKGQVSGVAPYALKSCYNVGMLNVEGFYYVYGAGRRNAGVTNSYYLNTCMPSGVDVPQGGTERTATQMKSVSFPAMLNTDSTVYVMDEYGVNGGYPIFGSEHNDEPVSIVNSTGSHFKICILEGKRLVVNDADNLPIVIVNVAGQIIYKTYKYTGNPISFRKSGVYIIRIGNNGLSKIYIN